MLRVRIPPGSKIFSDFIIPLEGYFRNKCGFHLITLVMFDGTSIKFYMEVPGIKTHLNFDFGLCRSKVKVHSS